MKATCVFVHGNGKKSQEISTLDLPGLGPTPRWVQLQTVATHTALLKSLEYQILLALRADISVVIWSELKNSIAKEFNCLKNEIQAMRANNIYQTTPCQLKLKLIKWSMNIQILGVAEGPGSSSTDSVLVSYYVR